MSGLDNLIAFIDNGGTRSGSERRRFFESEYMPERRMRYDRRSGADRRRSLNKKRKQGKERRTTFVDWCPYLKTKHPIMPCSHTPCGNPQGIRSNCPGTLASDLPITRAILDNPGPSHRPYEPLTFVTSTLQLALHNCPQRSWCAYSIAKNTRHIFFWKNEFGKIGFKLELISKIGFWAERHFWDGF